MRLAVGEEHGHQPSGQPSISLWSCWATRSGRGPSSGDRRCASQLGADDQRNAVAEAIRHRLRVERLLGRHGGRLDLATQRWSRSRRRRPPRSAARRSRVSQPPARGWKPVGSVMTGNARLAGERRRRRRRCWRRCRRARAAGCRRLPSRPASPPCSRSTRTAAPSSARRPMVGRSIAGHEHDRPSLRGPPRTARASRPPMRSRPGRRTTRPGRVVGSEASASRPTRQRITQGAGQTQRRAPLVRAVDVGVLLFKATPPKSPTPALDQASPLHMLLRSTLSLTRWRCCPPQSAPRRRGATHLPMASDAGRARTPRPGHFGVMFELADPSGRLGPVGRLNGRWSGRGTPELGDPRAGRSPVDGRSLARSAMPRSRTGGSRDSRRAERGVRGTDRRPANVGRPARVSGGLTADLPLRR